MSERGAQAPKVAIFGAYSDHDQYQRNRTLVNAFERLSRECVRIRPRRSGRREHGFSFGAPLFSRLLGMCRDAASLWSQRASLRDCDVIFVPYPAYLDILLLWFTGQLRGRRLIADAFLELHSTVVEDRKLLPPGSLRARALLWFQRFTLGRADIVFIDTVEQAVILRKRIARPAVRIVDVPVGIDETMWTPLPMPDARGRITVLFWGTFIPLHGIEHIVAAARILQSGSADVEIRLIGDGQTAAAIAQTLREREVCGLRWDRGLVDTAALRMALEQAHIVLGIFGESEKAGSVVPYKVHQALASDRPVITRAGASITHVADPDAGLLTCPAGDPQALALLIEQTAMDLREGWMPTPRRIYDKHLGTEVVTRRVASALAQFGEQP